MFICLNWQFALLFTSPWAGVVVVGRGSEDAMHDVKMAEPHADRRTIRLHFTAIVVRNELHLYWPRSISTAARSRRRSRCVYLVCFLNSQKQQQLTKLKFANPTAVIMVFVQLLGCCTVHGTGGHRIRGYRCGRARWGEAWSRVQASRLGTWRAVVARGQAPRCASTQSYLILRPITSYELTILSLCFRC